MPNKIKVNKKERDLLMKMPETYMVNSGECVFMGKTYIFEPMTTKDEAKIIRRLTRILNYWQKPWLYRLFHKNDVFK